ncbi:ATP-binding protein [Salinispirillum marinum]|uniref:histidine kinase n=2 Tax=Saccharospirillaceae TaxID=255527 RepID=A0ABV8BGZ2_9GAMM
MVLLAPLAWANDHLDPRARVENVLPKAYQLLDDSASFSFADVVSPSFTAQWIPVKANRLRGAGDTSAQWLSITLDSPTNGNALLLLDTGRSVQIQAWKNGIEVTPLLTPTLRGYAIALSDGAATDHWVFRLVSERPYTLGLYCENLGYFTSRNQWLSFYIYALLGAGLLAAVVQLLRQTARRKEHTANSHFLLWPGYLFTLVLFTLFQYVGITPLLGVNGTADKEWLPALALAMGTSMLGLMWWGQRWAAQDQRMLGYALVLAAAVTALLAGTLGVVALLAVLLMTRLAGFGIRREDVHQFQTVAAVLTLILWALLEWLYHTEFAITGRAHQPLQLTLLLIHGVFIQRAFVARVKQRPVFSNLQLPTDSTRDSIGLLRKLNHDLRSPINGVLGMASLLSDTQLNSQQQEYVATINNAGLQMLNLADEIRTLTRLTSDQMKIRPKRVELGVFIHDVVSPFAHLASQKMIEVATQILPAVPQFVRLDPDAVGQVLRILLDNAVRYTEEGDIVVTIRLEGENRLRLRVDDTGRGVPEQEQTTLFDFKAPVSDPNVSRTYLKLGLPIARALVHAMQGQIGMSRGAERGSSFWISIPFSAEVVPESATMQRDLETLLHKKVLIVDDHFACRRVLEDQTRGWGMLPELASDGKEALAILQSHMYFHQPFDWALIDYRMPRMNGLDLLRKIRSIEGLRRLKVIMLTGVDQHFVEQAVADLSTVGVLPKPINTRELLRLLQENPDG